MGGSQDCRKPQAVHDHAAFDGLSAVRLVASIARAYAGEPDEPGGPPDIEEARDLRSIAGARGLTDVVPRVAKIAGAALQRRTPLVRVAGDDPADPAGPGHAFATVRLEPDAVARAAAAKPVGATINDLLAAHALTIRRWNVEHGAPAKGRLSIMMPVNLHPAAWSSEGAVQLRQLPGDHAPAGRARGSRGGDPADEPHLAHGAGGLLLARRGSTRAPERDCSCSQCEDRQRSIALHGGPPPSRARANATAAAPRCGAAGGSTGRAGARGSPARRSRPRTRGSGCGCPRTRPPR